LRRAIQRYIEDPLSEALIQGNLKELSKVEVYMDGGQLWYRPLDRDREEVGVPSLHVNGTSHKKAQKHKNLCVFVPFCG
jgi:hypothetical protein